MGLQEIKGDIFNYNYPNYIVQQNNCVATRPHGFS